jgi:hypothetical protein
MKVLRGGKEWFEGTTLAEGLTFLTKMFAGMDDEGVVLVEERGVRREGSFEECADVLVGFFAMEEVVAFENTAGVGIDNKDRMTASVEENRVGGLRADAMNGQQLFAKVGSGRSEEFV